MFDIGIDIYDDTTGYDSIDDRGLTLKLHNRITASWYQAINLPGASGADNYRDNITDCNTVPVQPNDLLNIKPGLMLGPTTQGVEDLIAQDPSAFWDPVDRLHRSPVEWESPRVGEILIYDPVDFAQQMQKKGRVDHVKVVKRIGVFVENLLVEADSVLVNTRITPTSPFCGDKVCNSQAGEDNGSCPEDCPSVCQPSPEEAQACSDGIDNDCDLRIDCDDPDCSFACGAAVGVQVTPISLNCGVGQNCLHTITVTNGGPHGTTATVTEPWNLGSTVLYAGPPLPVPQGNHITCSVSANLITCMGDVDPGTSSDIVIVKQYQAPLVGTDFISLTSTFDSTQDDNLATLTTTVEPPADVNLHVQTATGGVDFLVGEDVVIVATVLNAGPASTTVTLTDSVFLIGSTVVLAESSNGDPCAVDPNSQQITCTVNMAPSTNAGFVFVKRYAFPEFYEEFLEATSSTLDPNLGDNAVVLGLNISLP